ncbi:toll/interleukin-1 receptor domain-containing protein [Bradyrhizobium sp. URHA0013]|uniref:toll/interleukin-1 receptor domain-containing protein n=1 Tax=Bradyrhizobium sp. URHA0013 TaxID=1380352 RepID=UPI000685882D|nr:toll/interleukin-1 receptor domain-containing protein [Bradyrhizobium sp. URHA0013]
MTDDVSLEWDLFISHASEDKEEFVRPLAGALQQFGVKVWYDEYALSLGDSLSRSVDKGLANSNFGLVVLSPAFLAKRWPEYELRGLTARELAGEKVILPVWHNVSQQELLRFSPPLADKLAVKSDGSTPLQVAIKIIEAIRPDLFTRIQRRIAYYQAADSATPADVPTTKLKTAPIRHESLPPALVGRVRLIRASLLDVYPHSMDFWLDGFRRDSHPSDEIAHWEHVAAVYLEYVSIRKLRSNKKKHEAFQFISNLWRRRQVKDAEREITGAEIMIDLYKFSLPLYDFDEPELPEQARPDVIVPATRLKDMHDREHFPKDFPEGLVRALMRESGKTK